MSDAPTLRELRATLVNLRMHSDNTGDKHMRSFLNRVVAQFEWLLDSYLFDTDESADDGGRPPAGEGQQ